MSQQNYYLFPFHFAWIHELSLKLVDTRQTHKVVDFSDSEDGFVLGRYRGPRVDPDILTPLSDFGHFATNILGSLEDELER